MTNDAFLRALGWALAHSIWQATAIALVLLLLLPRLQTARQRYWVSFGALLAVFSAAIGTFIWVYEPGQSIEGAFVGAFDGSATSTFLFFGNPSMSTSFWETVSRWLETNHTLVVAIWLLGFGFFLLRLVGGLWQVRQLRTQGVTLPEAVWLNTFQVLRQRLGFHRAVALLESTRVHTPVAIGWLKPVVLLPIGLVNRLSIAEVEAVLAHELAHIARRDWLFNLIQAFVESIFYYHPAVWWMSGIVRRERENCCDDAALAATGNPIAFAKALVQVQEMAVPVPALVLALHGTRPRQLLLRVRRILNQPQQRQQQVMEKITATVILLALLALVGLKANSVPAIEAVFAQISDLPSALLGGTNEGSQMVSDSLPKPKSIQKVTREEDNQHVEASYQDGKLIRLNIDGKEIPASEFAQHEGLTEELLEEMEPPAPPEPPRAPGRGWNVAPPDYPTPPDAPRGFRYPSGTPTAPIAPMPPYPPMPRSAIRVYSDKDGEGNTVIRLENNGDGTEVVVKDNEVYVNGEKLETGESLDIPGVHFGRAGQSFFSEGFGYNFETGEGDEAHIAYLKGISEEQREEMKRAMEDSKRAFSESRRDIEQQQKEMAKSQKNWEKDQKRWEKEQKSWEKEQQKWEKEQDKWQAEQRVWEKKSRAVQDALKRELLNDGLISNPNNFSLEINEKVLKVNKKKQSDEMRQKYLNLIESLNGTKIRGKGNYNFNFSNDNDK